MSDSRSRHFFSSRGFLAVIVGLVGAVAWLLPVTAQTFFEPTAAPPSGQSAVPLNASSRTQVKTGPLLIGERNGSFLLNCTSSNSAGCSKLCLNAATGDPGTVAASDSQCISAWADLTGAIGGPYLKNSTALTGSPGDITAISRYERQSGFINLQGNGGGANNTVYAVTGDPPNLPAVYATDGGDLINYAGYFAGDVRIADFVQGGVVRAAGKLCLNGTGGLTTIPPYRVGCITSWSEVISPPTNYVKLQTANPPTPQIGAAALGQSGGFGAVVVGVPPSGVSLSTTCGDGFCSNGFEDNTSGSPKYCPLDCATVPPVTQVSVGTVGGRITLTYKTGSLQPTGPVNMLIVRSTSPTFGFQPVDGVTYATGGDNQLKVVVAEMKSQNVVTASEDTDVEAGRTYYYRLYEANAYPRYSAPVDVQAGLPGPGENDDDGYIIPPRRK